MYNTLTLQIQGTQNVAPSDLTLVNVVAHTEFRNDFGILILPLYIYVFIIISG
jgi:hypothetical protein